MGHPYTLSISVFNLVCTGSPVQTKKGNPVEAMIRFSQQEWPLALLTSDMDKGCRGIDNDGREWGPSWGTFFIFVQGSYPYLQASSYLFVQWPTSLDGRPPTICRPGLEIALHEFDFTCPSPRQVWVQG